MNTTAIYENRIRDKKELLSLIPMNEFGDDEILFLTSSGTLICVGYHRIVFGDHGPYLEFLKENVIFENFTIQRKDVGYYNKYYSIDSHILLYEQRKDVSKLPNPPKGPRSFNGNRKEGYADYKVGRYYISPYEPHLKMFKNKVCINEEEENILKELL